MAQNMADRNKHATLDILRRHVIQLHFQPTLVRPTRQTLHRPHTLIRSFKAAQLCVIEVFQGGLSCRAGESKTPWGNDVKASCDFLAWHKHHFRNLERCTMHPDLVTAKSVALMSHTIVVNYLP